MDDPQSLRQAVLDYVAGQVASADESGQGQDAGRWRALAEIVEAHPDPAKAYVVTRGSYSDYEIVRVFLDQGEAQTYLDGRRHADEGSRYVHDEWNDVEEYILGRARDAYEGPGGYASARLHWNVAGNLQTEMISHTGWVTAHPGVTVNWPYGTGESPEELLVEFVRRRGTNTGPHWLSFYCARRDEPSAIKSMSDHLAQFKMRVVELLAAEEDAS